MSARRGMRAAIVALGLIAGTGLSTMLAAQESLLPPGFDEKPRPRATPAPRPVPASK